MTGNGQLLEVVAEDQPILTSLVIDEGQDQLACGTAHNLLGTNGYPHGLTFFLTVQPGARKQVETWVDSIPVSQVCYLKEPLEKIRAENVPFYFRPMHTPLLRAEPGVFISEESKGWLDRWVITSQMIPMLWVVELWPYWCPAPIVHESTETFTESHRGIGSLQFMVPNAADALGGYSEYFIDSSRAEAKVQFYKAAEDLCARARFLGQWAWSDMATIWDHRLRPDMIDVWSINHTMAELTRNEALQARFLTFKCQAGFDWTKHDFLNPINFFQESVA